jgi:CheY-like chemotaxis protein
VRLVTLSAHKSGWKDVMKNRSPYLLIVEDNPDDSFWLNRELKKADFGMALMLHTDAERAFDFLIKAESLPEALFLDIHLPGASGLHLLQRLKENPALAKIIVFVLDGSSSPKEIDECNHLGVAGFLDKPVTLEDLTNIVGPHLSDRG